MLMRYPSHGALTDVNLWDSVLTDQEISDWMTCETETSGNVVSWDTAELIITDLISTEVERRKTCLKRKNSIFMAFHQKSNFYETQKLCKDLGGEIGVTEDEEAYRMMTKAVEEVSQDYEYFFSGYTDRNKESNWVNVNTGAGWMRRVRWTGCTSCRTPPAYSVSPGPESSCRRSARDGRSWRGQT